MSKTTNWGGALVAGAATAMLLSGVALADGTPRGSVKDAPAADEGRKFAFSWNIGVTSDYIFRGISQNRRDPSFQGGVDITYGIFYAGIWGADVNFGRNFDGLPFGSFNAGSPVANVETDFYAGIKPVLGPVTFDLGVIHYAYWGGKDKGPRFLQFREQDWTELKVGASATFVPKLTTSITAFFAPQFQSGQGNVTTVEGTVAYELPTIAKVVPTVSGTVGTQIGDAKTGTLAANGFPANGAYYFANGKDSYVYWNVGLALGLDKLTLDFRYWDTNIPNNGTIGNNFCNQALFGCDGRFVASAKVTF